MVPENNSHIQVTMTSRLQTVVQLFNVIKAHSLIAVTTIFMHSFPIPNKASCVPCTFQVHAGVLRSLRQTVQGQEG